MDSTPSIFLFSCVLGSWVRSCFQLRRASTLSWCMSCVLVGFPSWLSAFVGLSTNQTSTANYIAFRRAHASRGRETWAFF